MSYKLLLDSDSKYLYIKIKKKKIINIIISIIFNGVFTFNVVTFSPLEDIHEFHTQA